MKKLIAICTAILVTVNIVHASNLYDQGFETDTTGVSEFGGTVTRVTSGTGGVTSSSGGHHAVLNIIVDDGAYTFGNPPANPSHGDQFYFAPGFGTVTQSIDIYIDPAMGAVGDYWDMEVTLEDDEGNGGYGEFNFQGQKTSEGYFIGRHTPAYEVTAAGWYTFATMWTEGATELLDSHTITGPGGFYADLGDMAGAQPALNPNGATAGYMWIFGRESSSLSLAIDNISYTPEPATMSLLALGGLALLKRRRRS